MAKKRSPVPKMPSKAQTAKNDRRYQAERLVRDAFMESAQGKRQVKKLEAALRE